MGIRTFLIRTFPSVQYPRHFSGQFPGAFFLDIPSEVASLAADRHSPWAACYVANVTGKRCSVAVGYVYEGCATRPYWEVQSAKIAGNDMMSSEIGGWNVDVHHVYSVQEGTQHLIVTVVITSTRYCISYKLSIAALHCH